MNIDIIRNGVVIASGRYGDPHLPDAMRDGDRAVYWGHTPTEPGSADPACAYPTEGGRLEFTRRDLALATWLV